MHDRLREQFGCHLNEEGNMVCDSDQPTNNRRKVAVWGSARTLKTVDCTVRLKEWDENLLKMDGALSLAAVPVTWRQQTKVQ